MSEETKKKRHIVHVTTPEAACGYVGHMTVDELKKVAVGAEFDASCPVCGQIHLTREEIEELESRKITESTEYINKAKEAEAE